MEAQKNLDKTTQYSEEIDALVEAINKEEHWDNVNKVTALYNKVFISLGNDVIKKNDFLKIVPQLAVLTETAAMKLRKQETKMSEADPLKLEDIRTLREMSAECRKIIISVKFPVEISGADISKRE